MARPDPLAARIKLVVEGEEDIVARIQGTIRKIEKSLKIKLPDTEFHAMAQGLEEAEAALAELAQTARQMAETGPFTDTQTARILANIARLEKETGRLGATQRREAAAAEAAARKALAAEKRKQSELQKSQVKTSLASQELVRIIQDLPFGVFGVMNNVQALGDALSRQSAKGVSAMTVLGQSFKGLISGPFALTALIAVVSSLMLAWSKAGGTFAGFMNKIGAISDDTRAKLDGLKKGTKSLQEFLEGVDGSSLGEANRSAQQLLSTLEQDPDRRGLWRRFDDTLVAIVSSLYDLPSLVGNAIGAFETGEAGALESALDVTVANLRAREEAIQVEIRAIDELLSTGDQTPTFTRFLEERKSSLLGVDLKKLRSDEKSSGDKASRASMDLGAGSSDLQRNIDRIRVETGLKLDEMDLNFTEAEQNTREFEAIRQNIIAESEAKISKLLLEERRNTIDSTLEMERSRREEEESMADEASQEALSSLDKLISEQQAIVDKRISAIKAIAVATGNRMALEGRLSTAVRGRKFLDRPGTFGLDAKREQEQADFDLAFSQTNVKIDALEDQKDALLEDPEGLKRKAIEEQITQHYKELEALQEEHNTNVERLSKEEAEIRTRAALQIVGSVGSIFGDLATLLAKEGKKGLEKRKGLLIAEATMNAIASGVLAVKAVLETPGLGAFKIPLAIATGASVVTTLMGQVRSIRNVDTNGGGGDFARATFTSLNPAISQDRVSSFAASTSRRGGSDGLESLAESIRNQQVIVSPDAASAIVRVGTKRIAAVEG